MNRILISEITKKSGKYIICIDRLSYKFHSEIVLKYNLRPGVELSCEKLRKILSENDLKLCFEQALTYLNNRMHSSFELRLKLINKRYDNNTIVQVIEKCEELLLINDTLFAENYINELKNRSIGSFKARYMLKQKGIKDELAEKLILKFYNEPDDDKAAIEKLIDKKYKLLDKRLDINRKREKLFRFLYSKGFPGDIILASIDEFLNQIVRLDAK